MGSSLCGIQQGWRVAGMVEVLKALWLVEVGLGQPAVLVVQLAGRTLQGRRQQHLLFGTSEWTPQLIARQTAAMVACGVVDVNLCSPMHFGP